MRRLFHLLLFPLLSCSSPTCVLQGVVHVGDDLACPRCTIELRKVGTIGRPDDSIDFNFAHLSVARDRAGRTYIGPTMQSSILVYDDAGNLVRSLTRTGMGPGELGMPDAFAIRANDTLLVVDRAKGLLIFGPDLRFVREIKALSAAMQPVAVVGQSGGTVAIAAIREAHAGPPIFLLDSAGTVVREFGPPPDMAASSTPRFPLIFAGSPGHIWLPDNFQYRLQEWSTDGTLRRTVVRKPTWFPTLPASELSRALRETSGVKVRRPMPWLGKGYQDSAGLVWTFSTIADEDWNQVRVFTQAGPHGPSERIEDDEWHNFYDTMIEVIDPGRGKLVAALRSDFHLRIVDGGPYLYSVRNDSSGARLIDLWRFDLKGRR
jgi:hypothetical protein